LKNNAVLVPPAVEGLFADGQLLHDPTDRDARIEQSVRFT